MKVNKIDYIISLLLLFPFIGSGFTPFLKSDISIIFGLIIIILSFQKNILFAFFSSVLVLLSIKVWLYVLVLGLAMKINLFDRLKYYSRVSLFIVISFLILELFFPEFHDLFFYRNLQAINGRGFSMIGPEPATTAFYLYLFMLIFWDDIKIRPLWLLFIFLTANIPIIIIASINYTYIYLKNNRNFYKNVMFLLSITCIIIVFFGKQILLLLPTRSFEMFNFLSEGLLLEYILNDRSIIRRLEFIPVILKKDVFNVGYLFDNINIPAGILVGYNYLGVLWIIFIFYFFSKINSLSKLLISLLFLVCSGPMNIVALSFIYNKFKHNSNDSKLK